MRGGRRVAVAALAVVAMVAASCSSGDSRPPSKAAAPSSRRSIEPLGKVLAEVEGVGAVYGGTVEDVGDLHVTATASATDAPSTTGALAIGEGMSVRVSAPFAGDLELRLQLPPAPTPDAIPLVIHALDDGSVQMEPGIWDPESNEIVVWVDAFSDRWGAWYDPRNWVEEVVQVGQGAFDFVADYISGRTDPPACANNPPAWARTQTHELSSLHTCTQSNPTSDDTERFEVYLKSNRRTAQVVSIPSTGLDYVWVQNQPDGRYRNALAAFAGVDPHTNVVLTGEHAMSLGLRRPQFSVDFELRAYQTWPVIVANPVLALLGNLPLDGLLAVEVATAKCLSEFSGFDITRADVIPDGAESPTQFLGQMVRCAFEVIQHPELAVGLAKETLDAFKVTGADQASVLANVDSGFTRIKPLAKNIFAALSGASVVTNTWDSIFDNLAEGSVSAHLDGSLSDEVLARLAPCSGCVISGRVDIDHPSWGRAHIISFAPPGTACGEVGLVAVDDAGAERWRFTAGGTCNYQLNPAGAGTYGSRVATPVDAAGRAFFDFNPGRYNGVIVLVPIEGGFEDYDTLPVESYDTRFYYALVVDPDGDGVYEVEKSFTTCYPSCGESPRTQTLYRFNDSADDFLAVVPSAPVVCGGQWLAVSSRDAARDITAQGVLCPEAVDVAIAAWKAHPAYGAGGPFAAADFTCTATIENFLEVYRCTSESRSVTFKRNIESGD